MTNECIPLDEDLSSYNSNKLNSQHHDITSYIHEGKKWWVRFFQISLTSVHDQTTTVMYQRKILEFSLGCLYPFL